MGKLTFQAALGGTVDLVGPNTASAVTLNLPSASGDLVGTGSTGVITTGMISGQVAVAQGGTGTASPALVAGTNVTITGTWPNQTINATGGGGGMTYPGAGIANSTGSAWGTSYGTSGASSVVLRDSDVNVSSNNFKAGWTSTVLSTTPVSLTNASSYYQEFTGAIAGQVVKLPYGPTAVLGQSYIIINNGLFQLDLRDAANVQIKTLYASEAVCAVCKGTSTSNNWEVFVLVPTVGPSGSIIWDNVSLQMAGSSLSGVSTFGLSGQLTSTVATGTAPFVVSSTTPVANLSIGGNAAGLSATLAVASGGTGLATTPANGALDIGNGTGFTRTTLTAGSGITITNGAGSITIAATNSGTVTSVTGTSPVVSSGGTTPAISLATAYGDTLNPYASKTANYVLAAPNGSAGVPTFRAIVAADIPTLNQNTTGTAAGLSSTLAIASGGTNTTATPTAGGVTYGTGTAQAYTAVGTAGQVLTSNGSSAPTWTTVSGSGSVTSVAATVPAFLSVTGSPITTSGTLAISYSGTALPVANGGTGTTTGSLVNCTVDGTNAVGYLNVPQNAQGTSYTLVLGDAGKHIYNAAGTSVTYTIPAATSVAYPIGTVISFINLASVSVTIAITTDTMYLSGTGTTGSRTLAQYGIATATKLFGMSSGGIWIISGSGLT